MATGNIRSDLAHIRTLKYTNSNAVADGDVVLINGHVCVATAAYAANAEGVYAFRARVELPKEAPLVIAVGDVVYWVAANSNVNKTSSANTKAGICVEAAASADTTVLIEVMENR